MIERDELESNVNELDPPVLEPAELETLELATKPYSRTFPLVDFSLDPEEFLATTAFERGQRNPDDPPDSPAEAPLKEIFYEPEDESSEGAQKGETDKPEERKRSPRKRIATPKAAANLAAAATSVASPRRKKGKQTATEEASGSELSELSDEDDEDEDEEPAEEEDAGESHEETAGEGEDVESYGGDGAPASQNGDEEGEEEEEEEEAPEPAAKRGKRRAPGQSSRSRSRCLPRTTYLRQYLLRNPQQVEECLPLRTSGPGTLDRLLSRLPTAGRLQSARRSKRPRRREDEPEHRLMDPAGRRVEPRQKCVRFAARTARAREICEKLTRLSPHFARKNDGTDQSSSDCQHVVEKAG